MTNHEKRMMILQAFGIACTLLLSAYVLYLTW